MPFVQPVILREQQDYVTDCYFCLTKLKDFSIKTRHKIEYVNVKYVSKTVSRTDIKPITSNSNYDKVVIDDVSTTLYKLSDVEEDEQFQDYDGRPHLINQGDLNDLVRDLYLCKRKAEILGSSLQQLKLLHETTRISMYMKRN